MGGNCLKLWLLGLIAVIALCGMVGCRERPVGVVLTYQIDVPSQRDGVRIPADELVVVVNHRVGRVGRARVAGHDKLEVDIFGRPSEAELEKIKRRISAIGWLEFRILANPSFETDGPIIEQAQQLPVDEKVLVRDGKKAAEWVAYSEAEFGPAGEDRPGIVKRDADGRPEALVLMDPWNVTGEYLTWVTKEQDERGGPAIHFKFHQTGAERLRELTKENRPRPATPGLYRSMGIIFDRELISAPRIASVISDRGVISGGAMTEAEVEIMIDVLNAGSLPAAIRLVDERRMVE